MKNKTSLTKKKPQKEEFLHMRCTIEQKVAWQKCADSQGLSLSKWIIKGLESHIRRTETLLRRKQPETTNTKEPNE